MRKLCMCLFACITLTSYAQLQNNEVWKLPEMGQGAVRQLIRIPDIQGYHTLKCDFHIHTVFSDGEVWPSVRVKEAWRQGLDAIAITDHIEYRPHTDQLSGDFNSADNIARKTANDLGFILIKGSEITRQKPLGHLNALFLTDSNPLDVKDPLQAIDIARSQGAVILWNHPGWPDNQSTIYPVHEQLLANHKIDMVEVHNYMEYYPLSFDWIAKYNIAPSANSDTHNTIENEFGTDRMLRPMTLVFAKDRSEAGIKEALLARRTAALFNGNVMARQEWAEQLFRSSIDYRIIRQSEGSVTLEVENRSDIPYTLKNSKNDLMVLPAQKAVILNLIPGERLRVMNVFVGHNRNLEIPVE